MSSHVRCIIGAPRCANLLWTDLEQFAIELRTGRISILMDDTLFARPTTENPACRRPPARLATGPGGPVRRQPCVPGAVAAAAHDWGDRAAAPRWRTSAALTLVRQVVHKPPDATLAELGAQLQQRRGLRISVATMCRVLKRLGLPRKKRPAMPRNATRRGSSRPASPTVNGPPRSRSGA